MYESRDAHRGFSVVAVVRTDGWPRFASRFWTLTWDKRYSLSAAVHLVFPISRRPLRLDFDDFSFLKRRGRNWSRHAVICEPRLARKSSSRNLGHPSNVPRPVVPRFVARPPVRVHNRRARSDESCSSAIARAQAPARGSRDSDALIPTLRTTRRVGQPHV